MARKRYLRGCRDTGVARRASGIGKPGDGENGDCMVRAWSAFLDIPYLEMWDIVANMNENADRKATGFNRVREWRDMLDDLGLEEVEIDIENEYKTITDWYQEYDSFMPYVIYSSSTSGTYHWIAVIDGYYYDFLWSDHEFWHKYSYGTKKPRHIVVKKGTKPRSIK